MSTAGFLDTAGLQSSVQHRGTRHPRSRQVSNFWRGYEPTGNDSHSRSLDGDGDRVHSGSSGEGYLTIGVRFVYQKRLWSWTSRSTVYFCLTCPSASRWPACTARFPAAIWSAWTGLRSSGTSSPSRLTASPAAWYPAKNYDGRPGVLASDGGSTGISVLKIKKFVFTNLI